MSATATITAIRAAHSSEFISAKMPAARPTMATAAENAYLVNKITFLQNCIFIIWYEGCGK